MTEHSLQYPVGRFSEPSAVTDAVRDAAIEEIGALPAAIRAAVAGLTDQQIETPYRDGGWTVRQVVHHLADSHMHAYLRVKFALTEESPTIRPYDEAAWSLLPDVAAMVCFLASDLSSWITGQTYPVNGGYTLSL